MTEFRMIFAAGLLICALAAILSTNKAHGHSFFSPLCCSDRDCKPLADDAIIATTDGWQLRQTGQVIPYDDARIKHSPDGKFHGCFPAGEIHNGVLCLYVPDMGV